MKNKEKKGQTGITLIALVITIIVLLILAGISIATLTGENGLLTQAENAKTETIKKAALEKVQVEVLGSYGNDGKLDYELLETNLNHIKGIKGVTSPITKLPMTVTVDGYEVTINNDGNVTVGEDQKEQPEETLKPGDKASTTVKNNYVDSEGNTATIPAEFTISETDSTISTGLVVIGPDGSEFVWIPVDTVVSDTEENGTINKAMAIKDGNNYKGLFYNNFSLSSPNSNVIMGGKWEDTISCEPDVVPNDADYNVTKSSLQNDYNNMIASVQKYNGFYIGRYESSLSNATATSAGTSGNIQSKSGVIPTAANNSATYMWYGLYNKSKTYSSDSVQSSMIWGSQWDRMLNWAIQGTDKNKILQDSNGNHSGSVAKTGSYSKDKINNIYDLEGNLREWSLESHSDSGTPNIRILHGSDHSDLVESTMGQSNPSYRQVSQTTRDSNRSGSRLTLYINL